MQSNPALEYDYSIAKLFLFATIVFGIVGLLLGVIIAFQMAFPNLNYLAGEFGTFGRLRPLHTNGIIYGFTLSGIWAAWYYLGQRVLKISYNEHPFLKFIGYLHFVLYIVLMALAVVSLFAGLTQSKEYSELVWPLDLLVVVVWVLWGVSLFGSMGVRREQTIYISLWYFIATFVAISALYIFNNLSIPTYLVSGVGSVWNSISLYAGTNDAMVQWWFGHNAVAFVFTSGIIGVIYYFLPKESGQPIFSYKLTLFSFWGLMFVYIWAGSHHLIYSTVPDWMQTMGSIFSVVLILPSWGTAVNMLLTMKGQWHQLKESPLIKFLILASTFYMLSTLEGPIQSIKSVNALAHFTDWIVGHVHDGVLGWVGFTIIAACYHMTPRLFKREIYSKKLMDIQFWIQTIAIILYFSSMWIAGITQGMMWRATDEFGSLAYSFIDTVTVLFPYYTIRAIGGTMYLIGFIIFTYNIIMTIVASRELEKEPNYATPMAA
ncbi:cytochrome-c oxidase, cbb3-type subunit I [Helicobacter pullorum]|uniref:cytochrome-c oxidase n=2 Tax=Helicobacter pullorum TaxID=35818 RepID=A0A0N0LPU5_9HELI|nr:cytochrome-c oxidase, cbb3-type subunit I [Helicobacter pullorum]EEQ63959.1 cytochrome c oxidase, cbb3-type, subunit I [Helicobacter pullorum MIT 98-5489]KAB0574285.1 cytochrome-c oxidase, cbb3-type subunit I [Helicobacter pullorum NCTC 12824]KPH50178.1 cbb3-type cytochrome c oxidase subunit I [Helicobacter pullorum]KPH51875.1 cbb3-type cytochrome c oxidase subunit I [Helicobacter pullorum]KPH52698.1 cbb3-type cytochrome c oxidase subunit I [Helicobacter pullorum]